MPSWLLSYIFKDINYRSSFDKINVKCWRMIKFISWKPYIQFM